MSESGIIHRTAMAIRRGAVDPTGMGGECGVTSLETILSDGDRIVGAPLEDLIFDCAHNALVAALDPRDEALVELMAKTAFEHAHGSDGCRWQDLGSLEDYGGEWRKTARAVLTALHQGVSKQSD